MTLEEVLAALRKEPEYTPKIDPETGEELEEAIITIRLSTKEQQKERERKIKKLQGRMFNKFK